MQGVTPQNRHVTSVAKSFLHVHWDQKAPLLLGYSGGPDSKALLYALIECGVKPHIAHIDHGWRKESRDEAFLIEQEARALGCPYFSHRLEGVQESEDVARRERLKFFASLKGVSALLLAHQKDDLAETVLKRVLEGAHLANFSAMQEVSGQFGMTIWRPFLSLKRSEILKFLEERSLKPLIDPSNSDPKYLRARMREEIFPFLNEVFGKNCTDNLALLSRRALELKTYLDQKIEKVSVQKGPWGTLADLKGLAVIEKRHLLQKITKESSFNLNRNEINTILSWVNSGEKSKILERNQKKILVDAERVWVF